MFYSRRVRQKNQFVRVLEWVRELSLLRLSLSIGAILLVWALILAWQRVDIERHFEFHHVKIVMQAQHLDPEKLAKKVGENIKGGFFNLDTRELYAVLKQEPWIQEITFRRIWPDILEVSVAERDPIARWNKSSLLAATGEIFTPSPPTFTDHLIKLGGPEGAASQVLQKFNEFQKVLQKEGAQISSLVLQSRDTWKMVINNQFTVTLGQKEAENTLQRFAVLYSKVIVPGEQAVVSVDMRYPNGAAIKWKQ